MPLLRASTWRSGSTTGASLSSTSLTSWAASASRSTRSSMGVRRSPATPLSGWSGLFGIPSDTWLRYEGASRADLARIADQENLAEHADEIDANAVTYLRGLGATKATKAKPGVPVSDFLAFHRCGTWESYVHLHETASTGDYALAALKESGATIAPTLLTAWLRAAELAEPFERGRGYSYDADQLRGALPHLRARAATPDGTMLRDIRNMLADVGVLFMVVDPPKKFPLLGMTRWIAKRVPVIQQTRRRGKDGF